MKILHNIIGTLLLFFSITFLSITIGSPYLIIFGFVFAPLVIIMVNKKFTIKPKKYYLSLLGALLLSLVLAVSLSPDIENVPVANNGAPAVSGEQVSTETKDDTDVVGGADNVVTKDTKQESPTNLDAKIHFIDTGNSDSILIMQGNKTILIDGGDNNDENLVTSYIKNQGIDTLSYVISTHPDADHVGGLDSVINTLNVDNLFVANKEASTQTYTDFVNAYTQKGIKPITPEEGSEFKLSDNSYIKIFNSNGGENSNDSSLVTLFVNGSDKLLFMGDAEEETEKELLAQIPDVDLIKVGHHASSSSTTQEFLDKVSPEHAVITVGSGNQYGHPTSLTLDKLQAKSVDLHRTDECGTILYISTGNNVTTECKLASFTPGSRESSSDVAPKNVAPKLENTPEPTPPVETPPVVENTSPAVVSNVILTQTGERYHRPSCRTIKKIKSEVSVDEAVTQGYTPCGVCKP